MHRNRAADEFVNCVVRRGDKDLLLKPSLIILALVVPLILGSVLALGSVFYIDANSSHQMFPHDQASQDRLVATFLYTLFATEAALASFLVFCVTRRNRNHLDRDKVWMTSLCDYVESHGGDAKEMRKLSEKTVGRYGEMVAMCSKAVWAFLVVVLACTGIVLSYTMGLFEDGWSLLGIGAVALIYVLLILQFAFTVSAVFGLPARHDSVQAKFTEELERKCALFGLYVGKMEHTVKRRGIWIHAVLMVITLGMYSFVYLFIACRDMNQHLRSQWDYEEELMRKIVEFEGGRGIECTEEGAPGKAARFLGNLM
ncbi:MAG: hypothetical protein Q4Q62_08420 [Thermoplasmata archaeon]|nr:hypothetical protein [Thermoplasmata archaeon]